MRVDKELQAHLKLLALRHKEWLASPVGERPGHLRTLKNGDFTKKQVKEFEKLYGTGNKPK